MPNLPPRPVRDRHTFVGHLGRWCGPGQPGWRGGVSKSAEKDTPAARGRSRGTGVLLAGPAGAMTPDEWGIDDGIGVGPRVAGTPCLAVEAHQWAPSLTQVRAVLGTAAAECRTPEWPRTGQVVTRRSPVAMMWPLDAWAVATWSETPARPSARRPTSPAPAPWRWGSGCSQGNT